MIRRYGKKNDNDKDRDKDKAEGGGPFRDDPEYRHTDLRLKKLERRLKAEYLVASDEVQDKLDRYMADFARKDAEWRAKVEAGEVTAEEYANWRRGQLIVGKRWSEMQTVLAYEYVNANNIANEMIYDSILTTFADNHNYGLYEVENAFHVDLGFTLYDRHAVEYIVEKNPRLLPMPTPERLKAIKEAGDLLWNKRQIQSVMLQGIMQGESIPEIAKRLADTVGERNYDAAVRNARTMTTAASNYGRIEAYEKAKARGVEGYQEWQAVRDERTRVAHREADGQRVQPGDKFIVDGWEMDCPGDPKAPGYLVYNCRCNVKYVPAGLTPTAEKTKVIHGYDSYEEWKAGKPQNKYDIERVGENGEVYRPFRRS